MKKSYHYGLLLSLLLITSSQMYGALCNNQEKPRIPTSQNVSENLEDNGMREKELWEVVKANEIDKAKELFLQFPNFDLEKPNEAGMTLLEFAIENHFEMFQLLVEQGADVNKKNSCGSPPLYQAMNTLDNPNRTKIINALLENKDVQLNIKDKDGMTALHWAAAFCGIDVVDKILKNPSIDIKAKDNQGKTALHWAAQCNNLDVVKFLLEKNADPNIKDGLDEKPVDKLHINFQVAHSNKVLSMIGLF